MTSTFGTLEIVSARGDVDSHLRARPGAQPSRIASIHGDLQLYLAGGASVLARLEIRDEITSDFSIDIERDAVTGHKMARAAIGELRRSPNLEASSWSLQQEGTLGGPGQNRWMGAIVMDQQAKLALGDFRTDASTIHPENLLAGRLQDDPLGTLSITDQLVVDGTGTHVNNRFGDYSSLSVDPVDGCAFWWTGEYVEAGTIWDTRRRSTFRSAEASFSRTAPKPATLRNGRWRCSRQIAQKTALELQASQGLPLRLLRILCLRHPFQGAGDPGIQLFAIRGRWPTPNSPFRPTPTLQPSAVSRALEFS